MSVIGLLVTGRREALLEFHLAVCYWLNMQESRRQTVHYSCMEEDLERALAAARQYDLTVQKIVSTGTKNTKTVALPGGASATVSDCIEEYPVLNLSSDGAKWEATA